MRAHDHPLEAKKVLARRIVQDFHSEAAAHEADANWAKQFQKDEVPENLLTIKIPYSQVYVKDVEASTDRTAPYYPLFDFDKVKPGSLMPLLRLDKIISAASLTGSNTEAVRKLKERAVRINGDVVVVSHVAMLVPGEFTLKVGRHLRKVQITK
jgi:tyrosyl-tRNA synthetase